MSKVFIVDGKRTPFLKARGISGHFSASDLAVYAARHLLAKMPFKPSAIDEVIVGCVIPAPDEANIARIVALRLGCGIEVPAQTVQRNCASGLQAVATAYDRIKSGQSHIILAGGTEVMSRAPVQWSGKMADWLSGIMRAKSMAAKIKELTRLRLSYLKPVITLLYGLSDPLFRISMGQTAEKVAHRFGITREEQDSFALESHNKLAEAFDFGTLKDELVPLFDSKGRAYLEDDGLRRDSSLESLAKLKPVFDRKYGSVTSGNSSQVTDGAAMLILAGEEAIEKYHLPVLGEVIDYAWAGVDPTEMGLGPVHATSKILTKQNLELKDIQHLELNEAFAAQVIGCQRAWKDNEYCKNKLGLTSSIGAIEDDKLNPEGGAIACGHPIGASGARIVLHLAKSLRKKGGGLGIATLCIGGGQGGAMLIRVKGGNDL